MITNKGIVILLVALMLTLFGLYAVTQKPAHAEGSTFINVFRQAGKHGLYVVFGTAISGHDNTGWFTVTDIGQDFICGKPVQGNLFCFPLDKVISVTVSDVDSLPGGGS